MRVKETFTIFFFSWGTIKNFTIRGTEGEQDCGSGVVLPVHIWSNAI